MIIYRAYKYLNYILLSKHRQGFGIHSPFVFDLVSRIFRNKIDAEIVCSIEKVRKKMISDGRSVKVSDLGIGSEKMITNIKKVSEIARYSPVTKKYGILLSNMAAEFGTPLIIEFGTSLGISTMYLASANRDTIVNTMEGCPAISEIAISNFKEAGFENINVFTGSFEEAWTYTISSGVKPGLVFIDGNHRKEPLLRYFDEISKESDSNTVIIIDDIYFSREMEEAWTAIKQSENVTLTIDIFRMGIVFFRTGLTYNNYTIRY